MNFNRPKTGNAPTVRKTIVRKPITQTVRPAQTSSSSGHPAPVRVHDPNRFKPTNTPVVRAKPANPAKRAVAHSRGVKRKSATPDRVVWSDDDDDSSDGSDSDVSRKRIKSSVSSIDSHGPRRPLLSEQSFKEGATLSIIHGADATSGRYAGNFKNPWGEDDFATCRLQYPSRGQREKFQLKWPRTDKKEDYKPMEDIIESIETVCQHYLPAELSAKYTNPETGYRRRFNLAWQKEDVAEFVDIVSEYNKMLKALVDNGTIETVLRSRSHLPLDWVQRILDQTYSRTVSPMVERLVKYEAFSENVYGELLSRFCSDIFKKTKLTHEMKFVDLGSGVGNVVLQAALEIGCDSTGIEVMPNPCEAAELQEREFPGRTKLWGLAAGKIRLLQGDFLEHPEVPNILKEADVVLVNNQAFSSDLNSKLLMKFLDLKEGCQVVSLKPFVPDGHKMSARNIYDPVNLFVQQKFEYFSDSVSWGAAHGNWYIARKDPGPMNTFRRQYGL
ncbi:hypothetical protein CBER1_01462 [Cercospora berteroae]|uniref:Histone-lysine N-methyltransferase, H3 lysine-79 specific n=1 Tax=Cercospora berteroae TaxID=357750 RepID=A0A2S6C5Q3_9PEZI|nr:hypothetical protein CBER1_01462 [Cercospora berteroae]